MALEQNKWLETLERLPKEADWETLARQYPWYSMGSLMRCIQHPGPLALQHAALHVRNPYLLSWLISLAHRPSGEKLEAPVLSDPAVPQNEPWPSPASDFSEAVNPPQSEEKHDPTHNRWEAAVTESETKPADFSSHTETEVEDDTDVHRPPLKIPGPGNESSSDELELQPYHTIDYFAAQGIITSPMTEVTSFDSRVRSFTQWLKTMKQINYQTGQVTEDARVTQMANASLSPTEVVTEAMAEVYAYQGLSEKAVAVYRKLTLRHPEKSALFAARIEKLQRL